MAATLSLYTPSKFGSGSAPARDLPVDEHLDRFVSEVCASLKVERNTVRLPDTEFPDEGYVLLNAGADPRATLSWRAESEDASTFVRVIPVDCGPGQGVLAMTKFRLPCFVESAGYGAWQYGHMPEGFTGLIARTSDAQRLGFGHVVGTPELCAIEVAESLPETLAAFITALAESKTSE